MSPRVLDCTEVRSSLPLYSGGDLHPDRQAALDRHLASCADCRAQAARANSAREALRTGLAGGFQRERTGGVDLWPSLRSSLVAEGLIAQPDAPRPRGEPLVAPIRRVGTYRRWLPVGAAAAAALLVGLWMHRSTTAPADVGPVVITPQDSVVVVPVDHEVVPTAPELVVTPVNDSQGLRRVQPGEPRWSDSADVFGAQSSPMLQLSPWSPNVGSPASLRNVLPHQR